MSEQEVTSSTAQKIIIKFLTNENIEPTEIYARLEAQFKKDCLPLTQVNECAKTIKCKQNDSNQTETSTKNSNYKQMELGKSLVKAVVSPRFVTIKPKPTVAYETNTKNKQPQGLTPIEDDRQTELCKSSLEAVISPRFVTIKPKPMIDLLYKPIKAKIDRPQELTGVENKKQMEQSARFFTIKAVPPVVYESKRKIKPPQVLTRVKDKRSTMRDPSTLCMETNALVEHGYAVRPLVTQIKHRQGKPLRPEEKLLAYNVFVSHRNNNNKMSKSQSVKRAARDVGISMVSMWNIVTQMDRKGNLEPPKKRKKRSTIYESLNQDNKDMLLDIVQTFMHEKEIPTIDKIYQAVKELKDFPPISRTTVYNQLRKLGFKYEKQGKFRVLTENKIK